MTEKIAEASRGFSGDIVVRKVAGNNWQTVEPLAYAAAHQVFHIPAGTVTDFASVPRIWAWLIPRAGSAAPAAILHDHLWRTEAPQGHIAYREADSIFRQALRTTGVSFVLRWLCWTAVRWGALIRPRGYFGWWIDAPLVLLCTAIATPVVVPPAIVVAVALAVVQLAEWVSWLVLRPFSRKRVNRPHVSLKT